MLAKIQGALSRFIDNHLEAAALYIFGHKTKVLLADLILSGAACAFHQGTWALWAHILMAQNWSFTYVSRARNSASLTRHLYAGTLSNQIWWLSQLIIFSKLFNYMIGHAGIKAQLLTGLFYTLFTLAGSIGAHAQALHNEKGKSAVGASKKYAQISNEDYARIMEVVAAFPQVQETANQAYTCAVGDMPTGAIACKVAGETVITGLNK